MLDSFPCTFTGFNICEEAEAVEACGFSCLSCPICEDPEPIVGADVIFQTAAEIGEEGNIIIFIDSSEPIAGIQASVACQSDGK